MQEIQDDILMAFNEGDEKAFSAVFKFYYREIFHFCDKLTGNTEEAKDITSRTFTSLFRLHKGFNTSVNIKAFLYITARNNSFNYLKSEKRSRNHQKQIADEQSRQPSLELDQSLDPS
ncbi:MAG: sigma-70 family RNA polymerase sigma factor [Niastella sp.]|uniref:sigma-70 family RNA polymerase sigma factor n=1 Tax=Niastella sp. TaxID=1869183 RepID=UPI00389A2071